MPEREDELGALWLKDSQAGKKYMSGKITVAGETVPVVVFKNDYKKEGERTPDYRIYRQQPREPQPERSQGYGAPDRQQNLGPRDDLDDEIPF